MRRDGRKWVFRKKKRKEGVYSVLVKGKERCFNAKVRTRGGVWCKMRTKMVFVAIMETEKRV